MKEEQAAPAPATDVLPIAATTTNEDTTPASTSCRTTKDTPDTNRQQPQHQPLLLRHQFGWMPMVVHIICLLVYLIPMTTHSYQGTPVLDELHICSDENKDVQGTSTLQDLFTNDYWGRPIQNKDSHKSWRPVTVLSFRWLRGGTLVKDVMSHRLVNVITHAATAEIVSLLATLVFPVFLFHASRYQHHVFRLVTKLFFGLHPTHVEVTANAANRPHLFAVMFATMSIDPSTHLLWIILFQILGLLCAETFLFQMPATLLTMTLIQFRNNQAKHMQPHQQQQQPPPTKDDDSEQPPPPPPSSILLLKHSMQQLIPRYVTIVCLNFAYIGLRWAFDTLSIPEGLIRPAENPFYSFVGLRRVRNYAYVLSIHVAKSCGVDFIGFSHEYGFECLEELKSWKDARLVVPCGMLLLILWITVRCIVLALPETAATANKKERSTTSSSRIPTLTPLLVWIVHLAWLATLFPISGMTKVGTFVADRIVVASTVSFCMLAGKFVTDWLFSSLSSEVLSLVAVRSTVATAPNKDTDTHGRQQQQQQCVRKDRAVVLLVVFAYMWFRLHHRTMDWMDSVPLLQSSLRTCPRSAKSNLEISKIYSGTYPDYFNLTTARRHLEIAETIDPDYCDVHQQFSHVSIQEGKYIEFEQRLVKGLMCPFSSGGCQDMWNRYWQTIFKDGNAQDDTVKDAHARHSKYVQEVNAEILAKKLEAEAKEKQPQ